MPRRLRRARRIVVSGHQLYWRFGDPSPSNETESIYQITVYSGIGGTSRLIALTVGSHLAFLPCKRSEIAPRYVEAIIREGLGQGWDPEMRSPDHRLAEDYLDVILRFERQEMRRLRI